jgi:cytochrome P450
MTVTSYIRPNSDPGLSLYHLYDPKVLADPYPLYHCLQDEDPVYWDPFLHAWVVTKYSDVLFVLQNFSAQCAPSPARLIEMGADRIKPIADIMVLQMLFMDPPEHTHLRGICSGMFKPHRLEILRQYVQHIVDDLLSPGLHTGQLDLVRDLGNPLSAIVTAELMGLPREHHEQLKLWSTDFAEILGNFQHNPDHASKMLKSLQEMIAYFCNALEEHRRQPKDDLIGTLLNAGNYGVHLTDAAIIANCILLMVGAQETTPNLIGNGMLTLLRNPGELQKLRDDSSLIPFAIEELLRYEAPSQHTTRLASHEVQLRGRTISKDQSVITVMGAANRDGDQFPDPDRVDVCRKDNKHLAFGGGPHFCFGAPLARLEGRIAFETLLGRTSDIALGTGPLEWRMNLGLRGLKALPVSITLNR